MRQSLLGKVIFTESTDLKEATVHYNQEAENKIKIGRDTIIRGELLVFRHGGEIGIGDHCIVGHGSRIWSSKSINIGDRVLIAHNVNIHDNVSHPLDSKERHEDFVHIVKHGLQNNVNLKEQEIVIEDDVWIGFNATIMKGVTIGKGAIIGANTVITKDIPPYAVVVGNPARIIKQTT